MKKELTLSDFQLPDTFPLEYKVLASALANTDLLGEMMRAVRPDFFAKPENRKVWEVIVDMYNKGEFIDFSSVHPRVDRTNFTEFVIGAEPVYGPNCVTLGYTLMETYIKRKAYFAAVNILQGVEAGENVESVMDRFKDFSESVVNDLQDNSVQQSTDVANDLANDIMSGNLRRIPTPFPTLNYMLFGGIGAGNLVILAARPSVGKTTIALQMAQAAARVGEKVTFYSLEMTSKELVQRLIVGTGYVSTYDIFSKRVDWAKYEQAVAEAISPNLRINDKAKSLDEICTRILLEAKAGLCTLAYVDYLGLIGYHDSRMTKAQLIGEITARLKSVAKEAGIPIVLLCQLNRDSSKEGRSPELTDLRDSGAIEQDGDVIIMLERPRDDMGVVQNYKIDMWLRKARNGKCNFDAPVHLVGNDSYFQFIEESQQGGF